MKEARQWFMHEEMEWRQVKSKTKSWPIQASFTILKLLRILVQLPLRQVLPQEERVQYRL